MEFFHQGAVSLEIDNGSDLPQESFLSGVGAHTTLANRMGHLKAVEPIT